MSDKSTSECSNDTHNKIQHSKAQPIYLINPACDDQIDLMDMVDTLINRWKTIVAIALLVIAVSWFYSAAQQINYISEAILVFSYAGPDDDKSDKSIQILFSSKATLHEVAQNFHSSSGEKTSVNQLDNDLKITMEGEILQLAYSNTNPLTAQSVLNLIVKKGMEKVENITRESLSRRQSDIVLKQSLITERVKQLRSQIQVYLPEDGSGQSKGKARGDQPLIRLGDSWSTVSLKVLNLHREYMNRLVQLKDMEIKHEAIKGKLANIKHWLPLKVIDSPTLPEKQKTPRKAAVTIGLFVGLMLGVIITLLFEAYSKHQKSKNERIE